MRALADRSPGEIIVAAAILAPSLIAAYILLRGPDVITAPPITRTQIQTVTQVAIETRIVPVATPIPVPVLTSRARTPCPAPRSVAPVVNGQHSFDGMVDSIVASPTNASWIAAFNTYRVYASRDAGASFDPVLDGDDALHDVGIDCYGHVIAVRGKRIGIRDGAHETWQTVPGLSLAPRSFDGYDDHPPQIAVIGGGPDIVLVGTSSYDARTPRIAVSSDLGATWSYYEIPRDRDYDWQWVQLRENTAARSGAGGRQLADGTIDIALRFYSDRRDVLGWIHIADGKLDLSIRELQGTDIAFAGDTLLSGAHRTTRATKAWTPIALPLTGDDLDLAQYDTTVPVDGPYPVIVHGSHAFRIVDGKAKKLPISIDTLTTKYAMDAAGRLWSIWCNEVRLVTKERWDRDTCSD